MAEAPLNEKKSNLIESLKMLQDWSKWLISLEMAVCAGLWALQSGNRMPGLTLAGWLMFIISIAAASILLLAIPAKVKTISDEDFEDIGAIRKLVYIQYAFFLLGLLCFALRQFQ